MAVGALYWTQVYYTSWKVAGGASNGTGNDSLKNDKHVESWWQMGQNVNEVFNMVLTVISCLAGAMGSTGPKEFYDFLKFANFMRSALGVKILLHGVFLFFAMFGQTKTYDKSYEGLAHTYIIEPEHNLQFWDFVFEWALVAVVYGLYPTMHGLISKVQDAAQKQWKEQLALKAKEALLRAYMKRKKAKKQKRRAKAKAAAKGTVKKGDVEPSGSEGADDSWL